MRRMIDMTEEIAEENDVVAAACCAHCVHSASVETVNDEAMWPCVCLKLNCRTFKTDVCKHYEQE